MASPVEKELEKHLECGVCLERFHEPKMLECQHSYCRKCLERLLTGCEITCPECKRKTKVRNSDVTRLPVNFLINKLLSIPGKVSIPSNVQSSADLCCKQHRGETLKLFCQSCDQLICRDCAVSTDHREHKYCFIQEVFPAEVKKINEVVEESKQKVRELKSSVETIKERKGSISKNAVDVDRDIESFVDDWILKKGKEYLSVRVDIQMLRDRGQSLKEQSQGLEKNNQALEKEMESLEEKMQDLEKEMENAEENKRKLHLDRQNLEEERQLTGEGVLRSLSKWQMFPKMPYSEEEEEGEERRSLEAKRRYLEETRRSLEKQRQHSEGKRQMLEKERQRLEEERENLEVNRQSLEKERQSLEKERQRLKSMFQSLVNPRKQELDTLMEHFVSSLDCLKNSLDAILETLSNNSQVEILSAKNEIIQLLTELNSTKSDLTLSRPTSFTLESKDLNPKLKEYHEEYDLLVKESLGSLGVHPLFSPKTPFRTELRLKLYSFSRLGGIFLIRPRNSDRVSEFGSGDITEVKITNPDGAVQFPEVEKNADGSFSFTYRPVRIGNHKIVVFVNDRYVCGNPFDLEVVC